jgi:hypothetical protein
MAAQETAAVSEKGRQGGRRAHKPRRAEAAFVEPHARVSWWVGRKRRFSIESPYNSPQARSTAESRLWASTPTWRWTWPGSGTRILIDGKEAKLSDLQQGDQVECVRIKQTNHFPELIVTERALRPGVRRPRVEEVELKDGGRDLLRGFDYAARSRVLSRLRQELPALLD